MDVPAPTPLHAVLAAFLQACKQAAASRTLDAGLRVRVKLWLQELVAPTNVPVWLRDRCHHAVLLLHCIDTGKWVPPLHKRPSASPLPALPKHTVAHVKAITLRSTASSAIGRVLDSLREAVAAEAPLPSPRRVLFGSACA